MFDEKLREMHEDEQPIARIRETERRKKDLDSEWRNTALELNAIYSTWAQTVYDKQKDLPSRLPLVPLHQFQNSNFDVVIDDGEESE